MLKVIHYFIFFLLASYFSKGFADIDYAGEDYDNDDFFSDQETIWYESITGFLEGRLGLRTVTNEQQKRVSIGEARAQFQLEHEIGESLLNVKSDILYDSVLDEYQVDLEAGRGWLDLRELNWVFSLGMQTDVKLGRQILTWGTGDLVFINDLFPKDWQAFAIGREESYLKAPSDAVKVSLFFERLNWDVVYTPKFDSDRIIQGERLSFYNPLLDGVVGRETPFISSPRNKLIENDEIAIRAFKNIDSYELAMYFYRGYWKSPTSISFSNGEFFHSRLATYGASIRGPIADGIGNLEIGFYDSLDDSNGTNTEIANSQWRFLLGYEQEIDTDLTGAVQFYIEKIKDYDAFKINSQGANYLPNKYRQLFSFRLTQLLFNQNLVISLFNYWSPSDEDGHLRFNLTYRVSDHLTWSLGANQWFGKQEESFFGQLKSNNNLYFSVRYQY